MNKITAEQRVLAESLIATVLTDPDGIAYRLVVLEQENADLKRTVDELKRELEEMHHDSIDAMGPDA